MEKYEFGRAYWQHAAMKLFFADYENPKEFYEKFSSSADLYYEIATQLSEGSKAYSLMYQAFMKDSGDNDYKELNSLVSQFQELRQQTKSEKDKFLE
jgi:hypothetical protein